AANEAASLRALGRNQQARNRLLEQLRSARDPSRHSLAELRYHDVRRLPEARRFELTINVRLPRPAYGEEESPLPRSYQRAYWVIGASLRQARRMARELEPPEAELRFAAEVNSSERLSEADKGIIERSPAIAEE